VPQAVCILPCRSCSAINSIVCLSCYSWSSQTILYNNTCITSCQIGFYETTGSGGITTCAICSIHCTNCNGASSNCTSCQNDTYYYNFGCYQACPLATYTSASYCVACPQPNCSLCNATTCSSCLSGFSLFNGSCLSVCLSNYYSYVGNCVTCASTCMVCSPVNGSCSSCMSPYLLYGVSCVSSCPSGVYQKLNNGIC
jgi:hypothetical protein